ncbi:hypothetical protein EDB82DRAFT_553825 [Fusarium venenatum]|uniref:uncharacterized protein n=1 Tax=Fusarium venenatum TaxID=56646 RepID=UPI001E022D59|nr:hypothetical protein EDB82DRAFT_553825 [Fusarium venenatum]
MICEYFRSHALNDYRRLQFLHSVSAPLLLPEVNCISKLLIRRKDFPNINLFSLTIMMHSLTCLESVHIERWSYGNVIYEGAYERCFMSSFNLPQSVKDFSFYQDNNTLYYHRLVGANHVVETMMSGLLSKVAEMAENIAISHAYEAKVIFKHPYAWRFKKLKTLALTSVVLAVCDEHAVNSLLCRVAKAAKEIPKLETLEIWGYKTLYQVPPYDKITSVAIFTYKRLDQFNSCISWKSNSSFKMSEETQAHWNDVADGQDANVSVKYLELDPNVSSIGAIHNHLALMDRILHNTSWAQV